MAAAMLSRSGVRVFASAAKDNKPAARVVPKASLNDAPKMFKETGAEAPMPTASLNFTTTPFDNYKFAPIREATVSINQNCNCPTATMGNGAAAKLDRNAEAAPPPSQRDRGQLQLLHLNQRTLVSRPCSSHQLLQAPW